MLIDPKKCIGCGLCLAYCPVKAISLVQGKAGIDPDLCLECGNCIRLKVVNCPGEAIYEPAGIYETPRAIRRVLSDPTTTHSITKVPGRGTEEVKTNDVTGRVCRGEVGIAVEMGRPCLGTSMEDVEKVTTALAPLGVTFEECNPLTLIMADRGKGLFDPYYRKERVASAIIEFSAEEADLEKILKVLQEVAPQIHTVFSLDVIGCYDENGVLPLKARLKALGIAPRVNAKVNLGLGVPYVIEKEEREKRRVAR